MEKGNIPLTGYISPTSDTDTFATHKDIYGKGGIHTYETGTLIFSVPVARRSVGMFAYVEDSRTMYQLIGGIEDEDWKEIYYIDDDGQIVFRVLGDEGYVLSVNSAGDAVASPALLDTQLDVWRTRQADFILGKSSYNLPNAQALEDHPDGFVYNTAGVISTEPVIPPGTITLTNQHVFVGNASNIATDSAQIPFSALPSLAPFSILAGSVLGNAYEEFNYVRGPGIPLTTTGNIVVWSTGIPWSYGGRDIADSGVSIPQLQALVDEAVAAADEATAASVDAAASAASSAASAVDSAASAVASAESAVSAAASSAAAVESAGAAAASAIEAELAEIAALEASVAAEASAAAALASEVAAAASAAAALASEAAAAASAAAALASEVAAAASAAAALVSEGAAAASAASAGASEVAAGISAVAAAASALAASISESSASSSASDASDYANNSQDSANASAASAAASAASAAAALSYYNNLLATGLNALPNSGNVDLQGFRIVNAANGVDPQDYVTMAQLSSAVGGTGTVTSVAVATSTSGISISGSPITTSGTINVNLNAELQALSTALTNGIIARTGLATYERRTLTGTSGRLTVTNGDGVSGNPTFDIATSGVTAGSYTVPNLTIDAYGRVTNAASASRVIEDNSYQNFYLGFTSGNPGLTTNTANFAAGRYVMPSINGGTSNFGIGYTSLYHLINGNRNSAVNLALYNLIGGSDNVGIGVSTLNAAVNNLKNVAVGNFGLQNLLSGDNNTTVGHNAAYNISNGSDNIFVGGGSGSSISTINNSIVVGANAVIAASNAIMLGNSSNTGIGIIGIDAPHGEIHHPNTLTARKHIYNELANNVHQYDGVGTATNELTIQLKATTTNLVVKAATSVSASQTVFTIKGTGGALTGGDIDFASLYKAVNLPTPTNTGDAANKSYVDGRRLDQLVAPITSVSMNSQKLTSLANGTLSTDAINLGQATSLIAAGTVTLTGHVTGSGTVGTPFTTTLALRLDQITAPTASLNLNSQKITSLLDGILSTDAATVGQVNSRAPSNATYIVRTPDATLTNEQALSLLTTGLLKNTTGTGVLSIGVAGTDYYAPNSPTRLLNTATSFFAGTTAGNLTQTGINCTGTGVGAGSSLTNGTGNTFHGYNAGNAVTTGINNTAVGSQAMQANSISSTGTAHGAGTFLQATTITGSTAIGAFAGFNRTQYNSCTLLGYNTDTTVNNLTNATAVGANATVAASNSMVLGDSNVTALGLFGVTAPHGEIHHPNTARARKQIFYELADNVHQYRGWSTAATNTLGLQLDATTTDLVVNAAISAATSQEVFRIKGTGGAVTGGDINFNNAYKVINTVTPTASSDGANKGYVDNKTWTASQITDFNTAVRTNRLDQMATPTATFSMGGQAVTNFSQVGLGTNIANNKLTLFGSPTDTNQFYGLGISSQTFRFQIDATTSKYNWYAATSASTSNLLATLQGDGKFNLGGNIDTNLLSVNGSASKVGGGSWAAISDRRVKDVVGDYEHGLAEVLEITPVSFQYNTLSGYSEEEQAKVRVGIIAQDIENILPECIEIVQYQSITDMRQYDATALPYLLINAVKDLNGIITTLQSRIETLEQQLAA